jgi:hypothetical protein
MGGWDVGVKGGETHVGGHHFRQAAVFSCPFAPICDSALVVIGKGTPTALEPNENPGSTET